MIKNNETHYGSVAKLLHWIMAILLIGIFIVGYIMTNIPKSHTRLSLYDMHKATGLLLFSLFILRLNWRMLNTQPRLTSVIPKLQRLIAQSNLILLYILMFSIPVAGFFISVLGGHEVSFYYLFSIPPLTTNAFASHFFSNLHQVLGYVLVVAFLLHVLGALYHQFKIKDDLITRMWIDRPNKDSIQC